MRALVVYESMHGNTERIAEAIAQGIRSAVTDDERDIEIREVGTLAGKIDDVDLLDLDQLDLLVVGGPIHNWGMTRESTRKEVRKRAGNKTIVSTGIGIREFLADVHDADPGQRPAAATFDTAIRKRWFPSGSAAKPAARRLARRGYRLVAKPEHFYVEGRNGPLVAGELERARAWGAALVSAGV
jgi:hypothetical protein